MKDNHKASSESVQQQEDNFDTNKDTKVQKLEQSNDNSLKNSESEDKNNSEHMLSQQK
jgi:hypothetical protein